MFDISLTTVIQCFHLWQRSLQLLSYVLYGTVLKNHVVLVKTLSKKLKLDDVSLGLLSRSLFLQEKLQRTLDLLGLGGSFIVPDENGLSKCFINQCITMQCIIHQNRQITRQSTELVSY